MRGKQAVPVQGARLYFGLFLVGDDALDRLRLFFGAGQERVHFILGQKLFSHLANSFVCRY